MQITKTHLDLDRYRRTIWLLVPATVVLVAQLAVVATTGIESVPFATLVRAEVATAVWWSANLMAAIGLAMLIWRTVLVARYRPMSSVSDAALPTITVVVPAFNEGRQVLRTVRSLLASDYPADKLSIIAVDDGSQDDTWAWIRTAAAEAPGRVHTVRQVRNRGKRHALDQGIRRSRGTVIVTVDSDSEVTPETLRNLVSPFAVDARVGAVAGNVRVLNRDQGVIPRMLDVAFTYGFDFLRASQSGVNAVMCTPGALSAYRRDLVMRVRDEWLHQTFMGRPAGIGEDRAMTNLVLREGYHVTFQGNAVVYTEVPARTAPLCRMLLRWARSNLRESFVTARFMFRRFRTTPAVGARLTFAHHLVRLSWSTAIWLPALACVALTPALGAGALVGGALVGSLVPAAVYALLRERRASLWAFAYGAYSVVALSWIAFYALLTLQRNGWLTRRLPAPPVPLRLQTATTAPHVRTTFDRDAA